MTLEDIVDNVGEDAVLIGDDDTREKYFTAIVGYTDGRVVYSYEKLVECFAEEFKDCDGDPYTTAIEWIDYNIVRGVPYSGPHAPIIMYEF